MSELETLGEGVVRDKDREEYPGPFCLCLLRLPVPGSQSQGEGGESTQRARLAACLSVKDELTAFSGTHRHTPSRTPDLSLVYGILNGIS